LLESVARPHLGDGRGETEKVGAGRGCTGRPRILRFVHDMLHRHGRSGAQEAAMGAMPHVTPGLGCGIYPQRPSGCRRFICGWLLDPSMGPDLKPENCHVVFNQKDEQNIFATCDSDYPNAWRAPYVLAFMHRLARAIGPTRKVVLLEKGRTWFVNEDTVVPADAG
jgi:hypothetical protein